MRLCVQRARRSGRRFQPSIGCAFILAFIITTQLDTSSAQAFNPFKVIKDVAAGAWNAGKAVVREVGSFLGAGPGGFIGAATAPTINQAEAAGHRLIDDADKRFADRLKDLDK